jgi:hypothetical protein
MDQCVGQIAGLLRHARDGRGARNHEAMVSRRRYLM